MSDRRRTRQPRTHRLILTGALILAMGELVALASCSKHGADDVHLAETKAPKKVHGHGDENDLEHVEEGAQAGEVTLTADAIERYGVRIAEAQLWILKPSFVAPARVGFNTDAMAHVGSTLHGRAVEIPVRLGDLVKKGDALVIVECTELGQAQADFLLKRNAAQAAAPQMDLAKAAWDRAKSLLENSEGISLTEVQKREAEYKTAQANLTAAQSSAAAAENLLHILGMDKKAVEELATSGEIKPRYTIRAAIDGQVVLREVTLGELVNPDREALMVLADTCTLWVLADVPEARLPSVAPGAKTWVTVGSIAQKFEGQVAFVSPLVDPTTRTAQVRIEIPRSALGEGAIRPGMFAQVEIVANAPGNADPAPQVAIPQEAVQTVAGAAAVFVPVQGEPNTYQKRTLRIGPSVGGLVPVFAGLVEGESFVEAGSFILKAELGKGSAAHEH